MTRIHLLVVDQQMRIKQEHFEEALAALKQAIRERPLVMTFADNPRYPFPELAEDAQLLETQSLIEALEIRGWVVQGRTNGDITTLTTIDEKKVQNDMEDLAFWNVLAPFVEPGYLEIKTYEDDDHYRYVFDGTQCQYVEPVLTWPM